MTGSQVKLLACLFMLIDHMGLILFPDYIAFRVIGRLAFPLFAWGISIGYQHTRSFSKYIGRLLIFAFAFHAPFFLKLPFLADVGQVNLNIFFTLSLGLASIFMFEREDNYLVGILYVFLIGVLAEVIKCDYGIYGVFTIFIFHRFKNDFGKLFMYQLLNNLAEAVYYQMDYFMKKGPLDTFSILQIVSIFSLIFVYMYNKKPGKKLKHFFYGFYPIHLILLYLISSFL